MKVLIALCLMIVLSEANQTTLLIDQLSPECRPTLPENLLSTDPLIVQQVVRYNIRTSITLPLIQKQRPLLDQFHNLLLKMADSDSLYFTGLVAVYNTWAHSALINAEQLYPNFCSLARAINKTVQWHKTKNSSLYIEALEATHTSVAITLSRMTYALLKSVGCEEDFEPLTDKRDCWNNGFVAPNDELWEAFGSLVPCAARELVTLLSNSCDFIEKAAATIFNFSLLPHAGYIFKSVDPIYRFQMSRLITESTNQTFGKCCCKEWSSVSGLLADKIQSLANDAFEAKVEEIEKECQG